MKGSGSIHIPETVCACVCGHVSVPIPMCMTCASMYVCACKCVHACIRMHAHTYVRAHTRLNRYAHNVHARMRVGLCLSDGGQHGHCIP